MRMSIHPSIPWTARSIAGMSLLCLTITAQAQVTEISYVESQDHFTWIFLLNTRGTGNTLTPPASTSGGGGNPNDPFFPNPNKFDWLNRVTYDGGNGLILKSQHVTHPVDPGHNGDADPGDPFMLTFSTNDMDTDTMGGVLPITFPANSGETNPTYKTHPHSPLPNHTDIYTVFYTYSPTTNATLYRVQVVGQHTPEPGTMALLVSLGVCGAAFLRRRTIARKVV